MAMRFLAGALVGLLGAMFVGCAGGGGDEPEKRTAEFKVMGEDNCHRCWTAELNPEAQ